MATCKMVIYKYGDLQYGDLQYGGHNMAVTTWRSQHGVPMWQNVVIIFRHLRTCIMLPMELVLVVCGWTRDHVRPCRGSQVHVAIVH